MMEIDYKHLHRFNSKFKIINGCWEWQRSIVTGGYGHFYYRGKQMRAHRASVLLFGGEIPDGMCVLHRCDNPPCVNPDHLWVGTFADNTRDMVEKGRSASGEKYWNTKFTEEDVLKMRSMYTGEYGNVTEIAREFGAKPRTVNSIIHRVNWGHVV